MLLVDRVLVVLEVRAVRGADLAEDRAGLLHHVGDAVRAADLDQLSARHDDLAPPGERREHDHRGRRVVVHDGRGLGARQSSQQLLDVPLARGALARLAVGGEKLVAPPVRRRVPRAPPRAGRRDPGSCAGRRPLAFTTRTQPGSRRRAMWPRADIDDGCARSRPARAAPGRSARRGSSPGARRGRAEPPRPTRRAGRRRDPPPRARRARRSRAGGDAGAPADRRHRPAAPAEAGASRDRWSGAHGREGYRGAAAASALLPPVFHRISRTRIGVAGTTPARVGRSRVGPRMLGSPPQARRGNGPE